MQGGTYRDPLVVIKLNTDNSEDTSRCVSTDKHASKNDFRECSTLCLQVQYDKMNVTLNKNTTKHSCFIRPRSVHDDPGSVKVPFTGERKKTKGKKDTTFHNVIWFKYEVDGS